MILVNMRFENGCDVVLPLTREIEIRVHITHRIDDRELLEPGTANGVRIVAEAVVFETLEQHGYDAPYLPIGSVLRPQ